MSVVRVNDHTLRVDGFAYESTLERLRDNYNRIGQAISFVEDEEHQKKSVEISNLVDAFAERIRITVSEARALAEVALEYFEEKNK